MAVSVTKICEPERYSLSEAIQIAQNNAEASPGFEFELVRFLQTVCLSRHVPLATVFRGLEILSGMMGCGVMEERRLIALLRPFLRSSDPQIASKCVLVLGRRSSSMAWLTSVMAEADDRIRANLIESLWKRREPEIETLLRSALNDPHPRVMANAAYGLYILGIDAWAEGLQRLIGSDKVTFRISGIWVLKSSGALDAPERIKGFIRDPNAAVRRAAFDALIHFRNCSPQKSPVEGAPAVA